MKIALRSLAKNRLYAFINIGGLALGLIIFLFTSMLVAYEKEHDRMFSKRARIFTVGSVFSPASTENIHEFPNVRLAYGPFFDSEIEAAEHVSRSMVRKHLLTIGKESRYQGIRFVDTGFTRIFDFRYLHGKESALDDPGGIILTASAAGRLFGGTDVLGRKISLDHKQEMRVAAVIEDVAPNSHFNSSLIPDLGLAVIAPLAARAGLDGFKMEGEWNTLEPSDMTYVLLPENLDGAWLQDRVDAVYSLHAPKEDLGYISALKVRPLSEANTMVWDAMGFPVLGTLRLLGVLVLIIACANYTNLAAAQSFGRTREIGLRKTFGSTPSQLLTQFLVESLTLVAFSMIIAVACIELMIPAYNGWTGKVVTFDYVGMVPWLSATTAMVGLLACAYPAYLISRVSPIDSLRNVPLTGRKGSAFRGMMIAAQFSLSIFMLAMVLIIYFQNGKVREFSDAFLNPSTVVLEGVEIPVIREKHETLRREWKSLKGVAEVSFSSDVPFYERVIQSHTVMPVKSDKTRGLKVSMISVDPYFMGLYGMKLLTGRNFDRKSEEGAFKGGSEPIPVLVNVTAAESLGFGPGQAAIGRTFHQGPDTREREAREYAIIGLMEDRYFFGLSAKMKPLVLSIRPEEHFYASIRLTGKDIDKTLREIDGVWERVVRNFPIQRSFLDVYFNCLFRILQAINFAFAAFAGLALSLALIGLFGLAAFMAQRRTREIAIRKVMGASVNQITRLLIWQFFKPVIWSLYVAVPSAYLASGIYLDFFSERIDFVIPVILSACVLAILFAWAIVSVHAVKESRAKPVRSLRYE